MGSADSCPGRGVQVPSPPHFATRNREITSARLLRSQPTPKARPMKRSTGQDRSITAKWRPATHAVRAGTWRSEQGETSEAIYVNSGYSYDNAAQAAARFAGTQPGMTYSRTQNPSVQML